MSYTKEQLAYINFDKKEHTKLLACAGSGKTRCIIARMCRLIEKKKYGSDEIFMLTFSRFTRDDFLNRIKSNGAKSINTDCINTIDKFAKLIIDPNGTIDVSLLSYTLMKFLENEKRAVLLKNPMLKRIKTVFIDEAQDLNEIQYRVLCALRDKLGVVINMVGDPNQNIFQFRKSSDKYLTGFEAKEFLLTHNFRSSLPVVDFSKHLRPYTEHDVICTKGDNGCKPAIMFYDTEEILEKEIIDLLTQAKAGGIDLKEFAILSPTRGMMRGCGDSHGLCFITNILFKAGIKFKQFYEESADEQSGDGIKYQPEEDHVNILTYMGSKGLEWQYVIIIDADMCLINKNSFDAEKHKNDRYLLYVACSRAINNMFIFSKCTYSRGDYQFKTNPWFQLVPDECYVLDANFKDRFYFPPIKYKPGVERENRVAKIIDRLDCQDLDEIASLLDFRNRNVKYRYKIFNKEYTTVEKSASIFLARFTEVYFQALYNIKMNRPHMPFPEIEHILEGDKVVTSVPDTVSDWYFKNKKIMTWEKFDTLKNLDPFIKDTINRSFDRNKPFNSHVIALNDYYQMYILGQKTWIKNLYKKYLKCKNTVQIREILFYLMVIKQSMETHHYFHIKSKGKRFEHILSDFKEMFDEIEYYVDDIEYNFVTSNKFVERWGLLSRIEFIDDDDKIWYIKCTNEVSLKHTIIAILSYLMHNINLVDDMCEIVDPIDNGVGNPKIPGSRLGVRTTEGNDSDSGYNDEKTLDVEVNCINFMRGEEITYNYTLTSEKIKRIVSILTNSVNKDPFVKNIDTNDVKAVDEIVEDIVKDITTTPTDKLTFAINTDE